MLLSTGTVYGWQYHTVAPIMYDGKWQSMSAWCTETFGPTTGSIWSDKAPNPSERWYENNSKFWFKDPADLTLFLLKWA